jgi:hypothetical protein
VPTGRPPKAINKLQTDTAVRAIQAGNTLRCAAALAGISWRTFTEWRDLGGSGEEPYASFLRLTEEAEANAEETAVKRVVDGFDKDPRHAQWWLERRRREEWWLSPKQQAVNVNVNGGGVALNDVPLKELEAALEQAAALKKKEGS